ncbi:adenylyl-sulfate kinase [Streptomyces sp. NPDC021218]|uniref:adenylyl-sulfate kinase n=1 Tax=Streptomyces TaxID=1883 RepID=UPI00363CD47D
MSQRFCTCWPGAIVRLSGLSGSGHTELAWELARRLHADGRRVEVLDRERLLRIGVSDQDGAGDQSGAHRLAMLASVLARNGVLVLVALTAHPGESRSGAAAPPADGAVPCLDVRVEDPCTEDTARAPAIPPVRRALREAAGEAAGTAAAPDPDLRITRYRTAEREAVDRLHALLVARRLAGAPIRPHHP